MNSLFDQLPQIRRIPEYYDTMYLDGFTPQEIYIAHQKRIRRMLDEWRKQKEERQEKEESENESIEIIIKEEKKR